MAWAMNRDCATSEGQFATKIGSPTNASAVVGYEPASEKTCSWSGNTYRRFVVSLGGSSGHDSADGSTARAPPRVRNGILIS